jgi:hypothetical protein
VFFVFRTKQSGIFGEVEAVVLGVFGEIEEVDLGYFLL